MDEKMRSFSETNRPSFRPGDVIAATSDAEKLAVGWKPGDPIPADLARRLAAAAEEAAKRNPAAKPANLEPPPISFDAVQATRQQELIETVQNIRQSIESAVNAAKQSSSSNAASVENQILMQWPEGLSVEGSVYNVSDEEARQQAKTVNAVPSPGSSDFVSFTTESRKEAEPAATAQGSSQESASDSSSDGGNNPGSGGVSRGELLAYIQAKLSLQRFSKSYSFFGGKFEIKFRTLKTTEAEACREQVRLEGRWSEDARVTVSRILPYRMVWAIDTMSLDGRVAQIADFLDASFRQYVTSRPEIKPEDTPTAKRYRIVTQQTYLADEQLWNIAYSAYQQFEYLIAAMDQMVVQEGFFRATEG